MTGGSAEKFGGAALILGSILLTVYTALFAVLLPIGGGPREFVGVVLNPNWVWLAVLAFVAMLLMMIGFGAVYMRLRANAGLVGMIGFLVIEAAYLLQVCKITWELFFYPIIAAHSESAFLLRDAIILHDPHVAIFLVMSAVAIFSGVTLFCFTLYRSNAYPKLAAILIFVGAILYAVGPMISLLVAIAGAGTLSIGCFLLGLRLLASRES
jgi:hypothetical protein